MPDSPAISPTSPPPTMAARPSKNRPGLSHPALHIFEQTPESLGQWCDSVGMPHYRAAQILEWVYTKRVIDPALMTNLSKRDRELIAEHITFLSGHTVEHMKASDGVQKLLVQWHDHPGSLKAAPDATTPSIPLSIATDTDSTSLSLPIFPAPSSTGLPASDSSRQTECVLIPTDDRQTACISSQVGCPVGCRFCASGLGGLDANLSAGRIVEQVWRLGELPEVALGNGRITNVVFMGMGEPLSNFNAVTAAIRIMNAVNGMGLGISARKITISTVGLPKFITRLRDEFELPVTLALSLHAPNDELRRTLIPWAEYTTIDELLAACQGWFEKTGREITLEYTLLRDVNDRPEHAAQLAKLAHTLRANVNLIRFNEVGGVPFTRPRTSDVLDFQKALQRHNLNVHIRASRGRDIAAACGQLRHEKATAENT